MSGWDDLPPFDACGPLPTGVTVLEASAGTGKTFTIAALTARFVAAGMPLQQLLLVTFTRMATGELRERVRERLVTAERGLAAVAAGVAVPPDDPLLVLLSTGSTDEVGKRRENLARALADFDAATIATTHSFCQHILGGLGVAGDVEPDATVLDDASDLVEEVVDDLYVRRFLDTPQGPPFDRAEALRIGRIAVENPLAPIEPAGAQPDSTEAMRRRLALAVRDEVERRKRRSNLLTYDDLLTRLYAILADPLRGPDACQRLRQRYRVALVDEFQDTDPVQWEIMRRAFGQGDTTLVLIGDPKQAIYAFRGADVYAYLDAAGSARTRATLRVNWRSDQGLIDAYDALFRGVKLGHEGIAYRTVRAADANIERRLTGAPCPAALRLRVVHRDDGLVRLTSYGFASQPSAREHIARDLAADLVGLLSADAEVVTRHRDGSQASQQRVRPGHIAVLVRTHRQAAVVRDALDAAGIPAVINGAGSVFGTPIARAWLRLLEALERPASSTRAHAAALTPFLGWSAQQVATADEAHWESVHARLHRWAGELRRRGVASLSELITHAEGIPARILSRVDGERELTDLRHIGQLLHAAATSQQLGATALTAWLRRRIAEAGTDTDTEERSRRLESDAEAVQVLTIHRSKGAEFPIVYYPYLWEPSYIPDNEAAVFHDPDAGYRRTIDVGMEGSGFAEHLRRAVTEQRSEDLRLAYVALTRARHQAVVWWAGSYTSDDSPLGRLLFARDAHGTVATSGTAVPEDDEVVERFRALAGEAPEHISVERSDGSRGGAWEGEPAEAAVLSVSRFGRELDSHWRRASYSGITSAAHEARVGSEPEDPGVTDEAPPELLGAAPAAPALAGSTAPNRLEEQLRAVSCVLAAMPGGVDVGSFVHAVIERSDFAASDLDAELVAAVRGQRARWYVDIGDPAVVVAGLRAAIETPLGPLVGELRLRDIGHGDRRDELDFELPLVGGDRPTATLAVAAIGNLLRAHLPADDVLAGYAERLDDPALQQGLRGYLTGSIDSVVRIPDQDGMAPRFAVIDYKTNWLGVDGETLSAWHYRSAALAAAMQRAHYPLQALLYSVALHRYLRWRLPGYSPERNLGGVLYLFLRGMAGAETPRVESQPCGVFAWQPPAALVEALSDLLDRGAVA
ncbi:MAG: UvrD-helicase domain-containing protein [Euzebyaceae bacterium]|nr:UvrD-helicase domain-containing protein [Euzebyaceae bacterium]